MSLQSSTARRCCTGHMMAVKTKMSCQDINKKFSDEDTVLGTETILFRDMNSAMLKAKYLTKIYVKYLSKPVFYIFFCNEVYCVGLLAKYIVILMQSEPSKRLFVNYMSIS